jgi:hypothetical protein
MTMYYCGIDPDLQLYTAATVNHEGKLLFINAVKYTAPKTTPVLDKVAGIARRLNPGSEYVKADSICCIESQDASYTGRTNSACVQDLIHLAHVSGVLLASAFLYTTDAHLVKPHDWKGSVPKGIHQARTLKRAGIPYAMSGGQTPYPVPTDLSGVLVLGDYAACPEKIPKTWWQDITDSIGLAFYCYDTYKV